MYKNAPIPDEEVIAEVRCPLCKAKKGSPCVYVRNKVIYQYANTASNRAKAARVGQPTKRIHQERRDSAYRARRQARSIAPQHPLLHIRPELLEVAAAMRAFDLQEYERLKVWIVAYGDILANANVNPRFIMTSRLDCSHEVEVDELLEPGTLLFCPLHGYARVIAS